MKYKACYRKRENNSSSGHPQTNWIVLEMPDSMPVSEVEQRAREATPVGYKFTYIKPEQMPFYEVIL